MDIVKTLENCIVAIGGMAPRVDQPEIRNTAEALIRTLADVIKEMQRLDQEKKEETEHADNHDEHKDV